MSRSPLSGFARAFAAANPAAAGRAIESMAPDEAATVLRALSTSELEAVVANLSASAIADLANRLSPEQLELMIRSLPVEKIARFALELDESRREAFLAACPEAKRGEVREILTFPEDSAGRLMSRDFLALRPDATVRDAIEKIRQAARRRAPASYVYVVDAADRLAGVVGMRDLLLAERGTAISEIMRREIFSVNAFLDGEEVAHAMAERRYFAAPVVDAGGRMLGVVRTEEMMGEAERNATEDVQRMFGAGGEERALSRYSFALRKRAPWLHVNLLTTFAAAAVVAFFDDLITRLAVLAVFMPVVAGQGGNAGAQALAVVMRGLIMREVNAASVSRLLWKEIALGATNGLMTGAITAGVAWAFYGSPWLGLVVALAMIINLVFAGFAGAVIPLGMKRLGFDPAQSSTIVLTTVTDVVGFFSLLGLAWLFQERLM